MLVTRAVELLSTVSTFARLIERLQAADFLCFASSVLTWQFWTISKGRREQFFLCNSHCLSSSFFFCIMTSIRPFNIDDILHFNWINLDPLTETVQKQRIRIRFSLCLCFVLLALFFQYNMPFYMQYLAKWPDCSATAVSPDGRLMGYSMLERASHSNNTINCFFSFVFSFSFSLSLCFGTFSQY